MRTPGQPVAAFLAAILLYSGVTASVAAGQETPSGVTKSLVRVRTRVPVAKVFQDPAQFGQPGFPDRECALGCSQLKVELSWNLDTTMVTFSDGERAYWVSGLTVNVGYPSVDVYITPKYKPGSCEYAAVLEHETRHVEEDRHLLEEYAGRLQAVLNQMVWPSYANPAEVDSAEEVRERNVHQIEKAINPLMEEFRLKRERSSRGVDDRDRERGVTRRCAPQRKS